MNKSLLGSISIAATTTFFGWAALHLVPQRQDWDWVIYPGALLAMPGALFCAAVAAILSPQGFHGSDDFAWIIVPTNLLFYFLLFFVLLRRKNGPIR